MGIDLRLSNSEVQVWRRCKRRWWLAFYRRLGLHSESPTGPLAIGTRVHEVLAAYYSLTDRRHPGTILEEGIAHDIEAFPQDADQIEKDADLCRAMLDGYFEWVQETGVDDGLTILGDEVKVEVPSGYAGITLIGKLDVRAERDGVQLFMDHKTTASLTEPVKTLHMDAQMLHYHLLEYMGYIDLQQRAILAGEPPPTERHTEGALYNMLRKVKRTMRANPPFYERVEVRHNVQELRSHWKHVIAAGLEIQLAHEALDAGGEHHDVVPPSPRRECSWDCIFFPVCPMFDDGSNAEGLLQEHYVQYDPLARYAEEKTDG